MIDFSLPLTPLISRSELSCGGVGALPELTVTLEMQPASLAVAQNSTQTF